MSWSTPSTRRWLNAGAALAAAFMPGAVLGTATAVTGFDALVSRAGRVLDRTCAPQSADDPDRLLARMEGFARLAGTTGGRGRLQITVTDPRDYRRGEPPIAGTLRAAIVAAQRGGGARIGFARGLGDILLYEPLRPPANTTIDGGPAGMTVQAAGTALFILRKTPNVILTRLRLSQRAGADGTRNGDCISVGQGSDRVWIGYNQIGRCGDGLIDVTTASGADTPMRVTISHNILHDHDKTMLIATLKCVDGAECKQPRDPVPATIRVTLADNLLLRTGQRNPKVFGMAYVDMYRNALLLSAFNRGAGKKGALYGAATSGGGALLARDNFVMLDGGRQPLAIGSLASAGDDWGLVRQQGTLSFGAGRVAEAGATRIPFPPYPLRQRWPAGLSAEAAVDRVAAAVGPCAAGG